MLRRARKQNCFFSGVRGKKLLVGSEEAVRSVEVEFRC